MESPLKKMYYQPLNDINQGSYFQFSSKELLHNGIRYDATQFIEKSECAKEIFQKTNIYSIEDGITEQVFETFFSLAIGQVRRCPPSFIPNVLDLANKWKCYNVEPEIERQILEYPKPDLIVQVLLESPHNSFPRIYEFVHNNIVNFFSDPNFYELPVASLGRIFYGNKNPINSNEFSAYGPQLLGNSYRDAVLQIIHKKKDEERKISEMKKVEQIKNSQIQKLKTKSDKLVTEKKKLFSYVRNLEEQNKSLSAKLEDRKKQFDAIELQNQKDMNTADELRNQIQKLKKEISKKEKSQKEMIDMKKRSRQRKYRVSKK